MNRPVHEKLEISVNLSVCVAPNSTATLSKVQAGGIVAKQLSYRSEC